MKTFLNAFKDDGHIHVVTTDCDRCEVLYLSLMTASERFSPGFKKFLREKTEQYGLRSFLEYVHTEYKAKLEDYENSPYLRADITHAQLIRKWLADKNL